MCATSCRVSAHRPGFGTSMAPRRAGRNGCRQSIGRTVCLRDSDQCRQVISKCNQAGLNYGQRRETSRFGQDSGAR